MGGGAVSSLTIVATPVPSATPAFVVPVTRSEKVSFGSTFGSPFTVTGTTTPVSPGANDTVTFRAT